MANLAEVRALFITWMMLSSLVIMLTPDINAQASVDVPVDRGEMWLYFHEGTLMDTTAPTSANDKRITIQPTGPTGNDAYIGNWTYTMGDYEAALSDNLHYRFWIENTGLTPIIQPITFTIQLYKGSDAISVGYHITGPPIQRNVPVLVEGDIGLTPTTLHAGDTLRLTLLAKVNRFGIDFLYDSVPHPSGISLNYTVVNQNPSAYITADRLVAPTFSPINFTFYGFDNDGSIARYEVDFQGDGTYDYSDNTSASQINVMWSYEEDGQYTVHLRVWDDSSGFGDAYENVTITNRPPSITGARAEPNATYAQDIITFNLTAIDADGEVVEYRWDFDGDGAWDYSNSVSGNTTHAYEHPGTYSALGRVRDNDGGMANVTLTIEIFRNRPPVATIVDISPPNSYRGEEVRFIGDGYDYDGTVVGYEWESSINGVLSHEREFTTSYLTPGMHDIRFRVKDNTSAWSDYAQSVINVSAWYLPSRITTTVFNESKPSVIYHSGQYALAFVEERNNERSVALTRSSNGRDWSIPITVVGTDFHPNNVSIAYFNGRYYMVFDSHGKVYLTSSSDLDVWSMPYKVTPTNQRCIQPSLYATGEKLWLAYVVDMGTYTRIYASFSTDGVYFEGDDWVTYDTTNNLYPSIVSSGNLTLVAFSTDSFTSGSRSVAISRRLDTGWSIPVGVGGSHVTWVSASLSKDGTTYIFFQDRVGGGAGERARIYYTQSKDLVTFADTEMAFKYNYGGWNDTEPSAIISGDGGLIDLVWRSDRRGNWDIYHSNLTLNARPVIIITSPEDGGVYNTTDTITFDASQSYDPDGTIISFKWTISPTGYVNENATFTRSLDVGNYTISFSVVDDGGARAETTLNIRVIEPANIPPVADAGSDITTYTGKEETYSASGSHDPDGYIVSYEWDFDLSDGVDWENPDASGLSVKHIYYNEGTYIVTLRVEDNLGAVDEDNITVLVVKNNPPVAEAGEDVGVNQGEPVYFDASQSYDPDGDPLTYKWDFDASDGVNLNTPDALGDSPTHTYTQYGVFTVTLGVYDGKGGMDTDTLNVTVNAIPIASIVAPSEAKVGESVVFDATQSTDPDGTIVAYQWDFDQSDGTGQTDAETAEAEHTYLNPGNYLVTLRVIDDKGAIGFASHTISIKGGGVNHPPTVSILNEGPILAKVDERVEFSARGVDPDDDLNANGVIDDGEMDNLTYIWDFGDGESLQGRNVTHRYKAAGTYDVVVRAVDRYGANATAMVKVEVNTPPQIGNIGDKSAYVGQELVFDASATKDADGDELVFNWDFGDGAKASGQGVKHTYSTPGNYKVTLNVTDGKHFSIKVISARIHPLPTPTIITHEWKGDVLYIDGRVELEQGLSFTGLSVFVQIGGISESGWSQANYSVNTELSRVSWSIEIDFKGIAPGMYKVSAVVADYQRAFMSDIAYYNVTYEGGKEGGGEGGETGPSPQGMWPFTLDQRTIIILAAIIVILVVIIAAALYLRSGPSGPVEGNRPVAPGIGAGGMEGVSVDKLKDILARYPEFRDMDENELDTYVKGIKNTPGTVEFALEIEKLRSRVRVERAEAKRKAMEEAISGGWKGHEERPEGIEGEAYKLRMVCPICKQKFIHWLPLERIEGLSDNEIIKISCPRCHAPGRIKKGSVAEMAEKRPLPMLHIAESNGDGGVGGTDEEQSKEEGVEGERETPTEST